MESAIADPHHSRHAGSGHSASGSVAPELALPSGSRRPREPSSSTFEHAQAAGIAMNDCPLDQADRRSGFTVPCRE